MAKAGPARALPLLALAAVAGSAAARPPSKPPPPTGELVLDLADPVITVKVGHVELRLRVGLEQKRLIELNPDAVERLRADPPSDKFKFEDDLDAYVGRTVLKSIGAVAPIRIHRRDMLVTLSSHGRDCCQGVDGEIGMGLLPYATIRFVRRTMPSAEGQLDFLLHDDDEHGPQATVPLRGNRISVQFSLTRPETVATSSAGAILATVYGGHLEGEGTTLAAFGIPRPTTTLIFRQPAMVAGFRFDRLPVRAADFAGHYAFPDDPAEPNDIVVQKKIKQQEAWPVVLIGRDRMDRCSEAVYDTIARKLTLRCAFDGAA